VLKRKRAPNGQAVKRVRKTVASEHNYEEGRVSDGVLETSSSRWEAKRKADAARPSKILRRRPNLSEMDVDNAASADESADEEAVEEQAVESEGTRPIVRKRRGTYNARTVAGTPFDKRIKANAHKRKQPYAPARTHPELDGVQANEMVGIQVDPHAMTMKDLATKLLSEGKVSSRALKLHAFQREEEERKRMERFERAEATWRCKQIQRRKLRAEHNADRARRREEMGSTGDDEDEVSADSDDSEETFEPQPDRMTPPSSPEPPGRISPSRIPSEHHHEEEDEGEDRATAGLEDEEGNDEAAVEENMDVAPRADEDEADAELRAAGFLVSSDVRPEDRGDEEEDEEIDWDMHQDDIEALRVQREEERRRIREEMGERAVEEQDDETTMVNAATFGKRQSVSERWTSEETEFFYMVYFARARGLSAE